MKLSYALKATAACAAVFAMQGISLVNDAQAEEKARGWFVAA